MSLRKALGALVPVVALALLASCAPTVDVTEDITTPTEWKVGTYVISSSLTVSAALTIPAGTTLEFAADTSLSVDANGSITAVGTDKRPITFTSAASAAAGDWNGVTLNDTNGTFTYCVFEYADTGLDLIYDATAAVTNCTFRYNTEGLDAQWAGGNTSIRASSFETNGEPLLINALYDVDASNTFGIGTAANTNQRIWFVGDSIEATRSWAETEVPYYLYSDLYVIGGTFTIAPGATLQFAADASLEVSGNGTLSAVGTQALPITFTSGKTVPGAGDWSGITVNTTSATLTYCVIEYAATGLELIYDGTAAVTNCTFRLNTDGLAAQWAGANMTISTNTFASNEGEPLRINALYNVDASNTFGTGTAANTNQRIWFAGDTIEATRSWAETEVPYYLYSDLYVTGGTFTIAAGATLQFAASASLQVSDNGTLSAVGTDALPITFTSGKTTKAAGDWSGITVNTTSATLTWCIIEYAETGLALIYDGTAAVTNCTFRYNTTDRDPAA